MISAVVPVKALPATKSRLRLDFDSPLVERLATAMLHDVVDALAGVPEVARIVVVTPDPDVAKVAGDAGAEALLRDDPGLNAAVDAASAEVAGGGDDGVLVVLGDVAGARSEELAQLLGAQGESGVVLAPSRDGGTSALLRTPHDIIPAGFGPESARVHRESAERAGVAFRELALRTLAIDVDRGSDLEALLRTAAPARVHTRKVWRERERTAKE